MKTIYAVLSDKETDVAILREAGEILKQGGLVAFPTETVYGLGGDALNPTSAARIYAAKGRPSDNPLIVHIAQWEDINRITTHIPSDAKLLADHFWPGPLTMIFKKSSIVPMETTGGLDTVAVRLPSHEAARALIREAGGYVAAPSANTSGRPSPTLAADVKEDMDGKIEMILDGGNVGIGLESTIIDLTGEYPMLLRPGYITQVMLDEVIQGTQMDPTLLQKDSKLPPKAPGMKYRHYAPKGEMSIFLGEKDAVVREINRLTLESEAQGERVGILATEETYRDYTANIIKNLGSRTNLDEIAHNFYRLLREMDKEGITVIYTEGLEQEGIGQAVMNRMMKAASHRVIMIK